MMAVRYSLEKVSEFLERAGAPEKNLQKTSADLCGVLKWAEPSTRSAYVAQIKKILGPRPQLINNFLVEFSLPQLTEEEAVSVSHTGLFGVFHTAVFTVRSAFDALLEGLNGPNRYMAVIAIMMVIALLMNVSGRIVPMFIGVTNLVKMGISSVSAEVAPSETMATAIPPKLVLGEKPPNKPTPTPFPTPTSVPVPIPKALLPEGSGGGRFMGTDPMPDSAREKLDDGVEFLASLSFGGKDIIGAIRIWRSVVDRFDSNGAAPSNANIADYENRMAFYKCQCSTELSPECRSATGIPDENVSWYMWFASLPPKYNLREDEREYIETGLALCELTNDVIALWPIPNPASSNYGSWLTEKMSNDSLKADVLISSDKLADFKPLWSRCGLSTETDSPFGEILVALGEPDASVPKLSDSAADTAGSEVDVPSLGGVGGNGEGESGEVSATETPIPAGTDIPSHSNKAQVGDKGDLTGEEFYRWVKSSVMIVVNNKGYIYVGTGFPVHCGSSVCVITNYHVIDGAIEITDQLDRPLTLLGGDKVKDIAILKPSWSIPPSKVFRLADKDPVVGDFIKAAGFPGGHSFVMGEGEVTAVNETANVNLEGVGHYSGIILVNAQGGSGISGGPVFLVSTKEVIGVYSAEGATRDAYGDKVWSGIGAVVPVSHVRAVMDEVLSKVR